MLRFMKMDTGLIFMIMKHRRCAAYRVIVSGNQVHVRQSIPISDIFRHSCLNIPDIKSWRIVIDII